MKNKEYKLIVPQDNALVTKQNKLIEARYSLSLQQQRLVLWIVSQIQPDDTGFEGFQIPIKELAQFLGIEKNKNIYKEMAGITEDLLERVVIVRDLEKDTLLQTHWIESALYRYKEGVVEIDISKKLAPYLLDIKGKYTSYSLRIAVSLRSTYSIRIYELLKQYTTIGKREITIEELRLYLGLKPEQYQKYSMFKKRTITRAQDEINGKTDIYFEYEEIKRGRKIHAIKFTIKKNESFGEVVKLPMGDTSGVALADKLKQHGVKDQIAWQIVHAYLETDPDRITWHIEELENMLTSSKKVKSPAGYIVKAIDTDHRPQKSLWQEGLVEAEAKAKKMRQEKEEKAQAIQHLESLLSDHAREYRNYVGSEVDKWREGLSESDIEVISKRIESELGTDWKVRDFRKNKWGSVFSSHHVDKYIRANITPLPYLEQDAYFKLKKKPTVSTLEKKLKKYRYSKLTQITNFSKFTQNL